MPTNMLDGRSDFQVYLFNISFSVGRLLFFCCWCCSSCSFFLLQNCFWRCIFCWSGFTEAARQDLGLKTGFRVIADSSLEWNAVFECTTKPDNHKWLCVVEVEHFLCDLSFHASLGCGSFCQSSGNFPINLWKLTPRRLMWVVPALRSLAQQANLESVQLCYKQCIAMNGAIHKI